MAPTRPIFFFNGRWVLNNFWHLDSYNFCDILRKNAKLYFLEASHWSLTTRLKSYPQGHPLWRNGRLKNWKFWPFWRFLFQKQKELRFSIFISQIFRQTFIISENLTYMGQPFLKLRAAQLAILFYSTSNFRWEIFKLPVSTFWGIT